MIPMFLHFNIINPMVLHLSLLILMIEIEAKILGTLLEDVI